MKKLFPLTALVLLLASYTPHKEPTSPYSPILMERKELEKSIRFSESRELEKPGKIYVHGNYLFLNEKHQGIHVFNNSNMKNPIKVGFIRVPGSIDMAIKDNILFVDNAVDLVSIDLSEIYDNKLNVTKRIQNVFPELSPPDDDWIPYKYTKERRPDNTVIVGWERIN